MGLIVNLEISALVTLSSLKLLEQVTSLSTSVLPNFVLLKEKWSR